MHRFEQLEDRRMLAADFVMVRDIDTSPQSSSPTWITQVGDRTFFVADTEETGNELWVSDGTPDGTSLVKDLNEGFSPAAEPYDGNPYSLFAYNETLYFAASSELWSSDGTDAGTQKLGSAPAPSEFVVFQGELYYGTFDGSLWKTDGTIGGTTQVAVVNPGAGYAPLEFMTVLGDAIYFGADDGIIGRELWKSDGTAAGTSLVLDVEPGAASGFAGGLTSAGGNLYFQGNVSSTGREPWTSDGTPSGTRILADIAPGSADSRPVDFTAAANQVFFSLTANTGQAAVTGGDELWVTDGTGAGTRLVKDINPGSAGSNPNSLTEFDGRLYFSASGRLWSTDGTEAGTVELTPNGLPLIGVQRDTLVVFNSSLYFTLYDNGNTYSLWKTDGSEARTVRLTSRGSDFRDVVVGGNELLFDVTTTLGGRELWRTDGSVSGTSILKDLTPGTRSSAPSLLTSIGNELVFSATTARVPPNYDGSGRELWVSGGTEASTVLLRDFNLAFSGDSDPDLFMSLGDKTIFSATLDNGISNMYVLDNLSKQISQISDSNVVPRATSILSGFQYETLGDSVIFPVRNPGFGIEIGISDGTAAGTFMLKDINNSFVSSNPINLTRLGSEVFFYAYDSFIGYELWKTDGTTDGTLLVKDISPGNAFVTPSSNMVTINGKLVFAAGGSGVGLELWTSDGTEAGTELLKDIWPGAFDHSRPSSLVSAGNSAFFFASDGGPGLGLFKTDATTAGTVLVRRFAPTSVEPSLANKQAIYSGGLLYFVIDDGVNGSELWVSDGTEPGTTLVKNINPGNASSEIENLTDVDGVVFFAATDGTTGKELWRTDGTAAGTFLAADVEAGAASSDPSELLNFNGTLYFTANTIDFGQELFRMNAVPIVESAQYSTDKDSAFNLTLSGTDADADSLTFEITTNPVNGLLTGTAPNLVYTPTNGFSGSDEFYFQASDGLTNSQLGRVQINVRGINPIITFDQAVATHSEAVGSVQIPYTLDRAAPFDLVIPLVSSGTADEGDDFIGLPSLFVPAGATSGNLALDIISDQTYEPGTAETVTLTMQPGSNYDLGTTTGATIQVVDDDPQPAVSFDTSSQVVDEVNQTVSVQLVLSAAASVPVQVPFTISGTAVSGSDYVPPASTTVTIPPGARSAPVEFQIVDDTNVEGNESVVFRVGVPTNAVRGSGSGSFLTTTFYISPNDIPIVNVSTVSQTVIEGESSIELKATLSVPASAQITVPFTLDGTAIDGQDYSLSAQQFVFASGSNEATVTFAITDDAAIEGAYTEFVFFAMSPSFTGEYSLGSNRNGFVYIRDNDATLSFSVSETEVWEDHPDEIDVAFTLSNVVPVDTTVNVTTGTTWEGYNKSEFNGVRTRFSTESTVIIPAGQISAVGKIRVLDDAYVGSDYKITVRAGLIGESIFETLLRGSSAISVKDNDSNLTMEAFLPGGGSGNAAIVPESTDSTSSFLFRTRKLIRGSGIGAATAPRYAVPKDLTVSERDHQIIVVFRLSKPTNQDVTFQVGATGTATFYPFSGWGDIEDLSAFLNGTVTISAGSVSSFRSLQIRQDSVFEGTETLQLSVTNPVNANIPAYDPYNGNLTSRQGGELVTNLKILDDEAPIAVGISTAETSINESRQRRLAIDLTLSGKSNTDTRISVELTGNADSIDDYWLFQSRNGNQPQKIYEARKDIIGEVPRIDLVIPAGQLSTRTFAQAVDDSRVEGNETFVLSITGSNVKVNLAQRSVGIGITDNDLPPALRPPVLPPTLGHANNSLNDAINGQLQISEEQGSIGPLDPDTPSGLNPGLSPGDVITPGTFAVNTATTGLLDQATVFLDSNFNGILDFLDTNNNGIQDAGELNELSTVTELDGSFGLYYDEAYDQDGDGFISVSDGRLVLTDGTDITINSARPVKLTAPVSLYSITPLTTLAESLVRQQSYSVTDALERVTESVGISGYNLRFSNALYEIIAGEPLAGKAYQQSVLVHNTVLQISSALASADPNLDFNAVAALLYDELAHTIAIDNSVLELTQPQVLSNLLDTVGVEVGVTLSATVRQGIIDIMEASATRIDLLTVADAATPEDFADSVLRIKKVVREQAVDRLGDAAAGTENISVTVSDFTGANLDTRIAAAVIDTILPASIFVGNAEVVEGNAGGSNLVFDIALIGDHNVPISVDFWTADDIATLADGDYVETTGTLNWAAGDNAVRTVTVPVLGDTIAEGDERLSLLLSNATNAVIRQAQGFGFIVNDDATTTTFSPIANGGSREVIVIGDELTGSAYANTEPVYDGVFTRPLDATFNGENDVEDVFRVELLALVPRADDYQFTGGSGAETDSLEWISEGLATVTLQISANDAGTATLETDPAFAPVTLTWSEIESLASHSTTVETFEIQIDGSISPDLILEDADPREFGRMRLRSASGAFAPIEFSNPNTTLKIVASNSATTLTTASVDDKFTGTVEFSAGSGNQAPTDLALSPTAAQENSAVGTIIGTLLTTDPDSGDSFTYSLVTGNGDADNASFAISGSELQTSASFDFETQSSYSVRVQTTDAGGLSFEKSFTINVTDVNETPTDIALSGLSVAENQPSGTVIGSLSSTDPDTGDTFTYSLASGAGDSDNGGFSIVGNELRTSTAFDFESAANRSVRVRTTDAGGLTFEEALTVSVTDVDETPPTATIDPLPLSWASSTITLNVSLNDPNGPVGEPVSGVASYDVYIAVDHGGWTLFANDLPATQTQVNFAAQSDRRYWFRAVATDGAGNEEVDSGLSETNTKTSDFDAPVTQVKSTLVDAASGIVTLQLEGTDSGGSGLKEFEVFVSTDGGVAQQIASSPVTATGVVGGVSNETITYQGLRDGVSHAYRFFTVGIDNAGNQEAAPAAPNDVVLTETFTAPASLDAVGIDVQKGQTQRSFVQFVDILFNNITGVQDLIANNRIRVERFAVDESSPTIGSGTAITGFTAVGNGNSIQLDFGSGGLGGSRRAGNGFYRISLDLNGDGLFDDSNFEFFRLYGDTNGDGQVTSSDRRGIREDLNGDGRVDSRDRRVPRSERGRAIDAALLAMVDD
jgi:ELWxxDGT repeat protein